MLDLSATITITRTAEDGQKVREEVTLKELFEAVWDMPPRPPALLYGQKRAEESHEADYS